MTNLLNTVKNLHDKLNDYKQYMNSKTNNEQETEDIEASYLREISSLQNELETALDSTINSSSDMNNIKSIFKQSNTEKERNINCQWDILTYASNHPAIAKPVLESIQNLEPKTQQAIIDNHAQLSKANFQLAVKKDKHDAYFDKNPDRYAKLMEIAINDQMPIVDKLFKPVSSIKRHVEFNALEAWNAFWKSKPQQRPVRIVKPSGDGEYSWGVIQKLSFKFDRGSESRQAYDKAKQEVYDNKISGGVSIDKLLNAIKHEYAINEVTTKEAKESINNEDAKEGLLSGYNDTVFGSGYDMSPVGNPENEKGNYEPPQFYK